MPLVLVPTPLGHLRDVTLRALDTLRDASLVVAEDTRVTRRLLHALGIGSKELWSYREQNAENVTAGILARARTELVALVTDAGMPAISDPGNELVAAAHANGVPVEVLPGPSAVLGVAVLSGFPLRRFLFEGFPPRASAMRQKTYAQALAYEATTIWYESPARIHASLGDLAAVAADARVFLVREYTKKFEQQVLGTPSDVAAALVEPVRGEIAFAIAPYAPTHGNEPLDAAALDARIDAMLREGGSVREIAKRLAEIGGGERRAIYARASERKQRHGSAAHDDERRP